MATSFGDDFRFTLLTDDAELAAEADEAGISLVGVDLERLGKAERQAGHDSWMSHHTLGDLAKIGPRLRRAELFARINPIHEGTAVEIEAALGLGARALMLPSFHTAEEVATFVRAVGGRACLTILVETAPAVTRIHEILAVRGVDEVMIGLNDLHLQLKVANHFEVLASPVMDMLAGEVRRRGLRLSVGGVGRADDGGLPVPSDLVYAQYPRLGATGAWIARSFLTAESPKTLRERIQAARQRLSEWSEATPEAWENAREELARRAREWKRTPGRSGAAIA